MSTKGWILTSVALIVAGSLMFTGAMTAYGWDFTELSMEDFEMRTYDVTEGFDRISLDIDDTDVEFVLSNDGRCRVDSYESESTGCSISVQNDTLIIDSEDRTWFSYLGTCFDSPRLIIHLPESEYGSLHIDGDASDVSVSKDLSFALVDISLSTGDVDLRIPAADSVGVRCTTGDITVSGLSVTSLDLSATTGEVTLSDVRCVGNIDIETSTGDVELEDVIVDGKLGINCTTGDVDIEDSDAAEIVVETDTGDVDARLLSGKTFYIDSNTGSKNYPLSVPGGVCRIDTDTGDINISVV